MKINLRLSTIFMGIALFLSGSLIAQSTWADYILEDKGDTVVVKPTSTTGYLNTMFHAIMGDTTAAGERTNANRVYETVRGGVYIYDGPARIDATVEHLRIVAPDGTDMPPLHIKTTDPEGNRDGGFYRILGGDFFMQNQYVCQSLTNDINERNFFRELSEGTRAQFDHCIIEMTDWTWFNTRSAHLQYWVTNCFMFNMGKEANLEKGNILDSKFPEDTIWFENNTLLNSGNLLGHRPNNAPSFGYFNHNTIVNSTQNPFLFSSQAEQVVTNNLFMNVGFVPTYPDFYPIYQDDDNLPIGIVNVDTLETAWIDNHWDGTYPVASDADRKVLVDKNNAWWDSRFDDMNPDALAVIPDSVDEVWASQMLTMNTRTQAMFDDDANYPYLNEGTWYHAEADFTNNKDLVPEWVQFIITNAIPGNPNGGNQRPLWRTNDETNLAQPDWPVFADLAYSATELKGGAMNGYPVGDLNWFPALKSKWDVTDESTVIIAAMKSGELPVDWAGLGIDDKKQGSLSSGIQTYPNPFSNFTTVKFEIAQSSNVELIVYNILGEKVRILELGQHSSGIHEVNFSKGDLNPGMYILQLNTNYNNAGLTTKISIK
jgi:type IX secretion system substrate protein